MIKRYQQQYQALGSSVLITLVTDRSIDKVDIIFTKIRQHINQFECRFSRFLLSSELTQFNLSAGKKTAVSQPFRKMLESCIKLSKQTSGLFNPFILPALQEAGYLGSWNDGYKLSNLKMDYSSRSVVSIADLTIDAKWAKIPRNSALDFGGIGKGYLLDELAAS